jgi:zinc protease
MKFGRGVWCGLALTLAGCAGAVPPPPAAEAAAAAGPAWPHQSSDLAPDPRVLFGRLDNGLRYAIVRNATPPGEASIRLRIDAGSLHEADDQKGLAHFLEHMVLNGTTHVPEGEFVRRLERAGLRFGADTNAFTSFDETVYSLDLPETDAATVDTALYLLREVADEAVLDPEAIDRERGIILAEERARANPGYRTFVDEIGFLLRGDLLPERLPIGSTEVIREARRERFLDFYRRFYRPERATLVAAGDFDAAGIEAKIRAAFGSWRGEGPAGAEPPPPALAARGVESRILVEPGGPTRISLSWLRETERRPDTRSLRRERLIEQLGLRILNRRLERIAATLSPPPFLGASVSRSDQAERAETITLVALSEPGQWSKALAAIEQEHRRALQHGFGQAELDREIAEIRSRLAAAAAGAATRTSAALAQGLVRAINDDEVFTAPEADLARFDEAVAGLTAAQADRATRGLFEVAGPLLYLTSPTPVGESEAGLLAAFEASRAAPVAAPAVRQAGTWPYDDFGPPGTVAERVELAGLDATAIRFANGVRLTVKPTDFDDDEILVSVRFGGGQIEVPADRPSPGWAIASGGFTAGGLGRLDFEDLQQALAGTVYSVSAAVQEDAFQLQGRTRPEHFERQMQVLAAYLADPGWRPTGWDRLRAYGGTLHDQMESTPAGVFGRDGPSLLRSGDRRWAFPSRQEMAASSIGEARRLLGPALAAGPIELVVVGDITVDEAIARAAATFGALPARQAETEVPEARRVRFPAAALERRTHKGRADQALAFIAWPTTDFFADQKRARTLNLLGQVLQLRLTEEIREKQGTTYSPGAGHSASEVFPGYGYLAAQIQAPPDKLEGFLADALRIAAALRKRPIDADELQRARQPVIENLQRQRAGNEWWLGQLGGVQQRPERAESIRVAFDQYRSITPAELQRAARDYLDEAKAWRLLVTPEAR